MTAITTVTVGRVTGMSLISASVANGVGDIVLNRPKALNALDQAMIDELYPVLLAWADDPDVETVLVTSGIDRAFCAGGDIRAIRDAALIGDTAAITQYFSSEYTLDQLIADYPKPYVALIDGAAMGGGLGISVHGEVRVVTEKALIAMPETAIGFFLSGHLFEQCSRIAFFAFECGALRFDFGLREVTHRVADDCLDFRQYHRSASLFTDE